MKEEVKVIYIDRSEEGALYQALNDYRSKRLSEGKTADLASDLIAEIANAPTKRKRVRDASR